MHYAPSFIPGYIVKTAVFRSLLPSSLLSTLPYFDLPLSERRVISARDPFCKTCGVSYPTWPVLPLCLASKGELGVFWNSNHR
jgi:hypothetical protein